MSPHPCSYLDRFPNPASAPVVISADDSGLDSSHDMVFPFAGADLRFSCCAFSFIVLVRLFSVSFSHSFKILFFRVLKLLLVFQM